MHQISLQREARFRAKKTAFKDRLNSLVDEIFDFFLEELTTGSEVATNGDLNDGEQHQVSRQLLGSSSQRRLEEQRQAFNRLGAMLLQDGDGNAEVVEQPEGNGQLMGRNEVYEKEEEAESKFNPNQLELVAEEISFDPNLDECDCDECQQDIDAAAAKDEDIEFIKNEADEYEDAEDSGPFAHTLPPPSAPAFSLNPAPAPPATHHPLIIPVGVNGIVNRPTPPSRPTATVPRPPKPRRPRSDPPANRPPRFICPDRACGKIFYYQSLFRKHRRTHTCNRPFYCKFNGCGRRFTQQGACSQHIRRRHLNLPKTLKEQEARGIVGTGDAGRYVGVDRELLDVEKRDALKHSEGGTLR